MIHVSFGCCGEYLNSKFHKEGYIYLSCHSVSFQVCFNQRQFIRIPQQKTHTIIQCTDNYKLKCLWTHKENRSLVYKIGFPRLLMTM